MRRVGDGGGIGQAQARKLRTRDVPGAGRDAGRNRGLKIARRRATCDRVRVGPACRGLCDRAPGADASGRYGCTGEGERPVIEAGRERGREIRDGVPGGVSQADAPGATRAGARFPTLRGTRRNAVERQGRERVASGGNDVRRLVLRQDGRPVVDFNGDRIARGDGPRKLPRDGATQRRAGGRA